jgi:hypothetical protein
MADTPDSEFRIGVRVDPSDAQAGLGEVQAGLGGVATGAEESAGRFENSTLQNRRNLTHLVRGLMEMKEGGVAAFGGIATEAYLAGEAMDIAMGPIGIILLGLSIAIPMLTRAWGEHKNAVDENATAETELGNASEEASKRRIEYINYVIDGLSKQLKAEMDFNEELDKAEGYNQKAIASTEKLNEARQKLAVAELAYQEQLALGKATSSDEKKEIEGKYKALIEQTQAASEADRLRMQISASAEEIAEKKGARNRAQDELTSSDTSQGLGLLDELQSHIDATKAKADAAAALGVKPNAEGAYGDEQKRWARELDNLQRHPPKEADQNEWREKIKEAGDKLNAADQAEDFRVGLEKWQEKLGPDVKTLTDKVASLSSDINDLTAANKVLQLQQQTQVVTDKTAQQKEEDEKTVGDAKVAFGLREADRYARKKQAEDVQDDPNATPDQKSAAKAQGDQVDVEGFQDKINNAAQLQLSQAEVTKLKADVASLMKRAQFTVEGQDKKDDAKETSAALQTVRGQIEATGNKELIAQARKIMETILDKHAELTQLQIIFTTGVNAKFQQIDATHESLRNQIRSLTNNHQS